MKKDMKAAIRNGHPNSEAKTKNRSGKRKMTRSKRR